MLLISNLQSGFPNDGAKYNRSDRRCKRFFAFLENKINCENLAHKYVIALKSMTASARHVFMVLYEKALFFDAVRIDRKHISRIISGYTHRKSYDVATISEAIKSLARANIFKVHREKVSNGYCVREYNTYRLSRFLRKEGVLQAFNIAVSAALGLNFCSNVTQINIYRNIYKNTNLQIVRENGLPSNIFPLKQEEVPDAPSDIRGKNARYMLNELPLVTKDAKKRWIQTRHPFVKVTGRLFFHEKEFDPAKDLSTRNYHLLFQNSVVDDIVKKGYSTRKVILPKEKRVRVEMVNPGPEGCVFKIIEFICWQILMRQRDLDHLLGVHEDVLRKIAGKGFAGYRDYAVLQNTIQRESWMVGYKDSDPAVRAARIKSYNIDPATFLLKGSVGESQAKKRDKSGGKNNMTYTQPPVYGYQDE